MINWGAQCFTGTKLINNGMAFQFLHFSRVFVIPRKMKGIFKVKKKGDYNINSAIVERVVYCLY